MKTFLIAEAGVNHNGDLSLAHQMVDKAQECGASCIKFQTHFADKEMIKDINSHVGWELYEIIERTSLKEKDFVELKRHCDDIGMEFMSTPFSIEAVDFLESIGVKRYKVGSGESQNYMLLDRIAQTGKQVFVSTGMSSVVEVENTVKWLNDTNPDFVIMHCTSEYPCPYDKVNLNRIQYYLDNLDFKVGFSDHTPTIYSSIIAVSMGAVAIEKHFTMDKNLPGTDHKSSIDPVQLLDLRQAIEATEQLTQDTNYAVGSNVQKMFRHSVTSKKKILKGEVFGWDNLCSKRPCIGIPTSEYRLVFGKTASRDIESDTPLQWEDVNAV